MKRRLAFIGSTAMLLGCAWAVPGARGQQADTPRPGVILMVPTPTPTPRHGWVLLVGQPELYDAPSKEAPSKPQDWLAGRRFSVVETLQADPASTTSHTWYRVAINTLTAGLLPPVGWLPDVYLGEPPPAVAPPGIDKIGAEMVDRAHGLPPDYEPADLERVGPGYEPNIDYRLRHPAARALQAMVGAARDEGIELWVVSGYRSWSRQLEIYERRIRETGWEQSTVAPPGYSEHQLGTAVDLTDGDQRTLLRPTFAQSTAGGWLREHAWEFGFALTYTEHNRSQTGYAPEPWHFRYWGIAQARTRQKAALGED
jgi:LAS superfamily LD-carboxypeptidase LdcB